jgi:hypothetical protein
LSGNPGDGADGQVTTLDEDRLTELRGLKESFETHANVASSGDVVIRKQGLSTVDTREPAIATTLSHLSTAQEDVNFDILTHRNRILLRGRHQEGRRSLIPDLDRIESAGSRWEIQETYVDCKNVLDCVT